MVGELLDFFLALPILAKIALLIGFLAPLSTLNSHLNPPPKPKLKPIKTVNLDDGTKLKVYKQNIEGEDRLFYSIS